MLRSSRTRLPLAQRPAIFRTAFGDAAAPASRGTTAGPACPSLASSPLPAAPGSLGTGAAVPPCAPAHASCALFPSSSTAASTTNLLLSPIGSILAEHGHRPISRVSQQLPRSLASLAAAPSTFVSGHLRQAALRSTLPGNAIIPSSFSSSINPSISSSSALFRSPSSLLTPSSRLFSSSSSSASSAPPSGFLSWYLAFLDSHPVVTKALTACSIFTVADMASQYLTYILDGAPEQAPAPDAAPGTDSLESGVTSFQWDPARTLRMAAAGLILSGPSLHVWYGLMARWRPGRDASSIAQKMLAGTFLYGPAFNAAFFSSNAALQGEGSREIVGRLKRDVLPTLVNGLMYWPFCDALTYRFVPVHLQSLGARLPGLQTQHSLSSVGVLYEEPQPSSHHHHKQQQPEQQREEGYLPRGNQGGAADAAAGVRNLVGRKGGVDGLSLAWMGLQFSRLRSLNHSTAMQLPGPETFKQSSSFLGFQPAASLSTACHRSAPLAASNQPQLHPWQASSFHSPFSRSQPSASLSTARQRLPQPSVGLRGVPVSFGVAPLESEMGASVLGPAWAGAGRARGFVQLRTILNVADNSGAKRVMCIKVLKGAKPNAAVIGDIIIASVRDADFHGKVKKGEVVTCVVVRSAMPKRRSDGSMVRFDGPAAVVINKSGEPIGTRVFGPVPHELRSKKLVKVLALAQLVT